MRPTLIGATAAIVFLLVPAALATDQDPTSFPAGVTSVSNTLVEAGKDFEVSVATEGSVQGVSVTVCNFKSKEAASPDTCFMNPSARLEDGRWKVSTSAGQHPAWKDGWILGYKVIVKTAGGDRHAPDRLSPSGEPDYYRLVVGETEPVQGTAVIEDVPSATAAGSGTTSRGAGSATVGLVFLVALAAAAKRR